MVPCTSCGSENRPDARFCGECGAPLAAACPGCGAANEPGRKFCYQCGAALVERVAPAGGSPERPEPAAERRLVSVLFADLVGFTTLSEARDAEEVRELLSGYFETARTLIERYGGTVEKFIGDAVMAVWGVPAATEDDAERAVRAALDLVAAVAALGGEIGAGDLAARAGVLTGEAAVTLRAESQGMVAGDLVNTASRLQAVAEPGTVLVGEATRRATEATVAYQSAGLHELKGKAEPVELWRAIRILSGRQGAQRSVGLEAPFVGRERELRLVKDLFHASADERRAHLVSVTGIAGIGKSRLAWEFSKYIDGLADDVYWHRGRCLAYGEGVTYWALADMVRMRARIGEEEEPASARAKLRATVREQLPDDEERAFVEPRLAQLLGLEEHRAEKQDLFAAWRLFFERLAGRHPTVLLFEDLQWADTSLLDFVEYLLEWSRSSPLYVVTLARPELAERRPTWGAGHRNFTSLYLEPLGAGAMAELLAGLVPGLPAGLQEQILARAEGIPLYAVETVRMLLDRGLLAERGATYAVTGEISALDVPETLHGLIAARLDGLPAAERRLLQDGAVLGKTFTLAALSAVADIADDELSPLLSTLVRKEVLSLQTDPTSPEQGQYGFLQDLVRHVAYETLSRRERRARHLAAAAHLEGVYAAEDEIAEVLAAHYLAAAEAVADAPDVSEVRAKAYDALLRAAARAESLAASSEAARYVERAASLADDPRDRAALLDRAGWLAGYASDNELAERLLMESLLLYEGAGETHAAARVAGRVALVEWTTGRHGDALARAERAFETVAGDEPDEDVGLLAGVLAGGYLFTGDLERAHDRVELALDIGESLGSAEVIARGLNNKALLASFRGRRAEALGLWKQALSIAREHDLPDQALSCIVNLSDSSFRDNRYEEALAYLGEGLELSRRRGLRPHEWMTLAETTYALYRLGRWDEALAVAAELPEESRRGATTSSLLSGVLEIHLNRGRLDEARDLLGVFADVEAAGDLQDRSMYLAAAGALTRADGRPAEAAERALHGAELALDAFGAGHQAVEQGLVEGIEAALSLGDRRRAEEALATIEDLPPGRRPPYLAAHARRFRARLAGADATAEPAYAEAAASFRELGIVFWAAVSQLELAEWLAGQGRPGEAEAPLAEAREIFDRLEATPWLERAAAGQTVGATATGSVVG